MAPASLESDWSDAPATVAAGLRKAYAARKFEAAGAAEQRAARKLAAAALFSRSQAAHAASLVQPAVAAPALVPTAVASPAAAPVRTAVVMAAVALDTAVVLTSNTAAAGPVKEITPAMRAAWAAEAAAVTLAAEVELRAAEAAAEHEEAFLYFWDTHARP